MNVNIFKSITGNGNEEVVANGKLKLSTLQQTNTTLLEFPFNIRHRLEVLIKCFP